MGMPPPKREEVFQIVERSTGALCGTYDRSYRTQLDFKTPAEARDSNCHGIYKDKKKYAIRRVVVTYEVVEEDVDGNEASAE